MYFSLFWFKDVQTYIFLLFLKKPSTTDVILPLKNVNLQKLFFLFQIRVILLRSIEMLIFNTKEKL